MTTDLKTPQKICYTILYKLIRRLIWKLTLQVKLAQV